MSSSYTVLNLGSGGDNIAMEAVTYGGAPTTRKRNHSVITGTTELAIADVTNTAPATSAYGVAVRGLVGGDVAHDAADANAPVKIGMKAVEDLESTLVSANDRIDWRGDLRGVPGFVRRAPRSRGRFQFAKTTPTPDMTAGLATDSEIFQLRWDEGSAGTVGHIHRIVITHFTASTAFTAGDYQFKLFHATNWTANGTGGSGILQADVCKLDVGGSTACPIGSDVSGSDIRLASTVALGVGTKTLGSGPMAQIGGWATNTIGAVAMPTNVLYDCQASIEPLILRDNTGIAILAIVPATGVWRIGLLVEFGSCYSSYGFGGSL